MESSPPEGWGLGRILSSASPGPSLLHKGQTDTHAQKSSTVSNLVTSCRLSCQARLRSFLKNHRAHLEAESTWAGREVSPFQGQTGGQCLGYRPSKVTGVSYPGGAEGRGEVEALNPESQWG